ncbi:MAG TPA: NAD(P)-dependent oxidoreductase [Candidatus Pacearchaeota archaeon]|nr:NAD(P)-dependent oxidoreductase [Candidatus Pacearchaeota archaeon]
MIEIKKNIAILGANSHIAKGLIENFFVQTGFNMHLFARSQDRQELISFLKSIGLKNSGRIKIYFSYSQFFNGNYDAIINCVGVGTKKQEDCDYSDYFIITETYDNLAIDYLRHKNAQAIYISFSSGVVYGKDFSKPAVDRTTNEIFVNYIEKNQYYAIARLNAETKHRSLEEYNIVDLRLFSYFSKFINLKDNYFIAELANCVLRKSTFETDEKNFIRDYLHPADLFHAVCLCLQKKKINSSFDISSRKPISKKEILDYFSRAYGLKYRINFKNSPSGGTGLKLRYYSLRKTTKEIGYSAKFTSFQTIKDGMEGLLKIHHN